MPVNVLTEIVIEPPRTVGTQLAFLGRRIAYTYQIQTLVPGEKFVMSTAEGPFPMETTYTWLDAASGGTLMRLRNRGEPAGFAKIGAPMMAGARCARLNARISKRSKPSWNRQAANAVRADTSCRIRGNTCHHGSQVKRRYFSTAQSSASGPHRTRSC